MIKRRRLCLASLILPCFLWKGSLSCLVCTTNAIQAISPAAARLLCVGQSQQPQQQQQNAAAFSSPFNIRTTTNSKTLLPALLPRHLRPLMATAATICSPQTKVYGANVVLMSNTGLIQMNNAMMPRNRNGNQLAAASDDSSMQSGDESHDVRNVDDDPLKEGGDRPADEEDVVEKYSPSSSSSSDAASATMLASLQFYKQVISPLLPPACRFVPTCSMYGVQAIRELGPVKGAILIAWRLLRCSPIGGKGYDPPRWPPVFYTYSSY